MGRIITIICIGMAWAFWAFYGEQMYKDILTASNIPFNVWTDAFGIIMVLLIGNLVGIIASRGLGSKSEHT